MRRPYVASRTCLLAGRGGLRMSAVDAPELDDALQQIYRPMPTSSTPVSRARLLLREEHPARGEGRVQGALGEAQCVSGASSRSTAATLHRAPRLAAKNSGRFSYMVIEISNEVERRDGSVQPQEIAFYRLCAQPCGGPSENPHWGSVELLIGPCRGNHQSARCGSRFLPPTVASWAAPSEGGHHEQPPECCGH